MIKVKLGDTVSTKKPHPCGSKDWQITRVGADYKLTCKGCGRTVTLSADAVSKSVTHVNGEKVDR